MTRPLRILAPLLFVLVATACPTPRPPGEQDVPKGLYLGQLTFNRLKMPDYMKPVGLGVPVAVSDTDWTGGCDIPRGARLVSRIVDTIDDGRDEWEKLERRYAFWAVDVPGSKVLDAIFAFEKGKYPGSGYREMPPAFVVNANWWLSELDASGSGD
jgi:hypothetical protein